MNIVSDIFSKYNFLLSLSLPDLPLQWTGCNIIRDLFHCHHHPHHPQYHYHHLHHHHPSPPPLSSSSSSSSSSAAPSLTRDSCSHIESVLVNFLIFCDICCLHQSFKSIHVIVYPKDPLFLDMPTHCPIKKSVNVYFLVWTLGLKYKMRIPSKYKGFKGPDLWANSKTKE